MSIVSDRVAVKAAAVTALQAAFAAATADPDLTKVGVFFGDPGKQEPVEWVALGDITGRSDPEVFGPTGTQDAYEIDCLIWTGRHATEQGACERAQEILTVVTDTLFRKVPAPRFGQSLGATVFPSRMDGPNGTPIVDGVPAAGVVQLSIGVTTSVRS